LFVFQAEDGIRDLYVTGVQTCALPIFKALLNYNCGILVDQFEQLDHVCVPHPHTAMTRGGPDFVLVSGAMNINEPVPRIRIMLRSEERRVGKEGRKLLEQLYV